MGKLLSFSNVVACLALFVALGGSVYAAGKISGKQIEVRSLPGNRIKPRTIVSNRIKPKTLTGRQVKPLSLSGRQIDQKTLSEISAAGLADVRYESVTASIPTDGHVVANCPAGTHVIGGGATISDFDEGQVEDSGPNQSRTGWTASGFSFSFRNSMTVTAICVAVGKVASGNTTLPRTAPTIPKYTPAD